jgi:AcrR family transcriptional regulator
MRDGPCIEFSHARAAPRTRIGYAQGVDGAERFFPKKWPIQARARATVDAMLVAAAHILETRGLAAVNTNAIAERAGVSIGSLYQYFPNKTALLALVADRHRMRVAGSVLDVLRAHEGAPLATALRESMHALGAELARGARLHQELFASGAPFRHGDPALGATMRDHAARALAGRVADPRAVASVLVHTLSAFAHVTMEARPAHLVTKAFADEGQAIGAAILVR